MPDAGAASPRLSRLGRYEVLSELGKGAMGVVYLAKDPVIGRLVAIKTIRTSIVGDDETESREFRERFFREAQTAGILSHPNIVTIHDIGEDKSQQTSFIAMEYIEGRNLKSLLAGGARFPHGEVAELVAQVAEALDYAHHKGVIHRDIKPANIIITSDGKVKITDFGIAKIASSNLTSTGQFLGTPNYMSPEQVSGAPIDGRSDIFSLGVVLYELLTHRKPFFGENLTAISYKIVHEDFTPPVELSPDVPAEFNAIVARAMAKDPWNRYQRGKDMALALYQLKARLEEQKALEDLGEMVSAAENLPTLNLENVAQQSASGAPHPVPAASLPFGAAEVTLQGEESQTGRVRPVEKPLRSLLLRFVPARLAAVVRQWKELARAEVNPSWFWRVTAAAAALALLPLGFLQIRAFRAAHPTAEADPALAKEIRDRLGTIEAGKKLFAAGQYERSLLLFRRVLARSPNNQEARLFAQMAENSLKGKQETERKLAEAASILALAHEAFSGEDFVEAKRRADGALALDGGNLEAQRLREESSAKIAEAEAARKKTGKARERIASKKKLPPVPEPPRGPGASPSEAASSASPAPPAAATAMLRLLFDSPISEGHVMVAVNEQILLRKPFSFVRASGVLKPREAAGTVSGTIPIDPGRVTIKAWLSGPGITPISGSTVAELRAGETRTLRLDYSSGQLSVRIR